MGAGGAASAWDAGGFLPGAGAGSHPYARSRRGSGEAAAALQLSLAEVFPAVSEGLGLSRGAAGLAGLGLAGGENGETLNE